MPATVAALVVVMSVGADHGEMTLKPMPEPKASSSKVKAAATKPPAMIAGHDTAETGGASASTITVSTMSFPLHLATTTGRCGEGSAPCFLGLQLPEAA